VHSRGFVVLALLLLGGGAALQFAGKRGRRAGKHR
jgi:hypothetical protein